MKFQYKIILDEDHTPFSYTSFPQHRTRVWYNVSRKPLSCFHFLSVVVLILNVSGELSATFTVTNKCNQTVWPAILSTPDETSPLNTTGFQLQNDESRNVTVPSSWAGQFWGRTHCSTQNSTGRFSCISGDCGSGKVECSGKSNSPTVTLAKFTLTSPSTGLDFYDVSFGDGFNLPILVVPESGNCTAAGCAVDFNDVCPIELKATSQDGIDVGCKNACEAFATPRHCCTGEYGTRDTCKPSPYSKFFKNACPRAHIYQQDDNTSTFQCPPTNYAITFCPPLPTIENPTKNPEAAGGGGGSLGPVSSSSTVRVSFVQFPGGAVSLFILLSPSALWKLF